MNFDLGVVFEFWPMFLKGLVVTLQVSAAGALLGLLLGIVLMLMRRGVRLLRAASAIYISFFRGTPLIVQIFFVFYALPGITGIELSPYIAGVMALGMNSSAFVAEILRGGMSAIPKGQFEAAYALGMSKWAMWRKVLLPQLFRSCIPPLTNEFTILLKATPPLSAITLIELTRTAQLVMNQTFRPMEAFVTAAMLYFVVLFCLSLATRRLEYRFRRASA